MAKKGNDELFDWTPFLTSVSTSKVTSQDKKPESALDSLINEFKVPKPPNKPEKNKNGPKRTRPHHRKEKPEKKAESNRQDQNGIKINRSNAMPVSPSDQVQVRSYIDFLDEFLGNTDNVASPVKSETDSFVSAVDDFEKSLRNLKVDNNSKQAVLTKLLEVQNIVSLKIKSLDPNSNRVENWVKNQNVETSSYKSDQISNASSRFKSNRSHASPRSSFSLPPEEYKVVNCQYCCERFPDIPQLIYHLDDDCVKLRERDFDSFKRNDLSYFQILPNDSIKCNICNLKFDNLLLKKEHDQSNQHKREAEKLRARDEKRGLTNYIFCSCCKINIPDNFIQFKMHLDNEEHVQNRKKKDLEMMAENGVQVVICRNNRVKCLACSHVEFNYDKEKFQQHLSEDKHVKSAQRKKMQTMNPIYCELCDQNFAGFGVDLHICSQMHAKNLKGSTKTTDTSMKNQYCLFCTLSFSDMMQLAIHQEGSCSGIRNICGLRPNKKEEAPKTFKKPANPPVVARNEEEEDEEDEDGLFREEAFGSLFKDKDRVENAAEILKRKSEEYDLNADKKLAGECAQAVGCKNHNVFGSRNCKLAFDSSDLNIYCNFFTNLPSNLHERLIKNTADECFQRLSKNPKFEDIQKIDDGPFIQCAFKETGRVCKIEFKVEPSELEMDFFKQCLDEDPQIQQFLLLLKLWLKVHDKYIGDLSSFVLIMLGVFFLRSKAALVLPVPNLTDSISKELGKLVQSSSRPVSRSESLTIAELFLNFCKFYKNFDYSSMMIFTGVREPLEKEIFESELLDKVPENQFTKNQCLWLVSYANPKLNIARGVTKKTLDKFVKVCEFTANRLSS